MLIEKNSLSYRRILYGLLMQEKEIRKYNWNKQEIVDVKLQLIIERSEVTTDNEKIPYDEHL